MDTKPSRARKVNIEVPPDLNATYANFAVISHSPSEIVIDLATVLPALPKARVHTRVIVTPLHAKLLLRALEENLKRYEAQFGEVTLPSGSDDLARQFFDGVKPPGPQDDQDREE